MHIKRIWILLVLIITAVLINFASICGLSSGCAVSWAFNNISIEILDPLYLYLLCAAPGTSVVIFSSTEGYRIWKKFSLWYLAISALIIPTFPVWSGLFGANREQAALFFGVSYTLLSIALIVWNGLKNKKVK